MAAAKDELTTWAGVRPEIGCRSAGDGQERSGAWLEIAALEIGWNSDEERLKMSWRWPQTAGLEYVWRRPTYPAFVSASFSLFQDGFYSFIIS